MRVALLSLLLCSPVVAVEWEFVSSTGNGAGVAEVTPEALPQSRDTHFGPDRFVLHAWNSHASAKVDGEGDGWSVNNEDWTAAGLELEASATADVGVPDSTAEAMGGVFFSETHKATTAGLGRGRIEFLAAAIENAKLVKTSVDVSWGKPGFPQSRAYLEWDGPAGVWRIKEYVERYWINGQQAILDLGWLNLTLEGFETINDFSLNPSEQFVIGETVVVRTTTGDGDDDGAVVSAKTVPAGNESQEAHVTVVSYGVVINE